mmetsp:Transcript_17536/g.41292  ORF Transcript_17536/g.41292 Transcript_17536/m.41292 type:complete len:314 (+) Transcript_17536:1335-2276(+)
MTRSEAWTREARPAVSFWMSNSRKDTRGLRPPAEESCSRPPLEATTSSFCPLRVRYSTTGAATKPDPRRRIFFLGPRGAGWKRRPDVTGLVVGEDSESCQASGRSLRSMLLRVVLYLDRAVESWISVKDAADRGITVVRVWMRSTTSWRAVLVGAYTRSTTLVAVSLLPPGTKSRTSTVQCECSTRSRALLMRPESKRCPRRRYDALTARFASAAWAAFSLVRRSGRMYWYPSVRSPFAVTTATLSSAGRSFWEWKGTAPSLLAMATTNGNKASPKCMVASCGSSAGRWSTACIRMPGASRASVFELATGSYT